MKFTEIAFVCYPSKNIIRSRRFYEKTLGLKPASIYKGKSVWVEYNIGSTTLVVAEGKTIGIPSKNGVWVALETDNFEKTIKELKKKRVKFIEEPFKTGVCCMASISDPDGSAIIIHKRDSK